LSTSKPGFWKWHVYSIAGAIDENLTSTDEVDVGTFQVRASVRQ
jgi:hypothetical protein